ncbi:hypothetical protein I79_002902 [Cricetulus griseus]|uniref:Uncharacterized protein n=1 Tax=Cricetulus griseus TaxID=10029 RepID=G3GYM2_CRIGR|nr:hypothetical protein I79_002902 [Cricetulus griseus]
MERGVHRGMTIPLLLLSPTPPHRESHGGILNLYSHPTDGMKMSSTEAFGENWEEEKKKKEENGAQMYVKGGSKRKPPLIK